MPRAHVKPETAAERPSHYARLGTERGKSLPAAPPLTLADLPVQRRRTAAAATAAATATAPAVPSSAERTASAPTATATATASQSAAPVTGWRPSAFLVEFDRSLDELLMAVLDGTVTVTRALGGVRLTPDAALSEAALAVVDVVRGRAAAPVRAEQVLAATGCTVDELLNAVLSGELRVYRALGGIRFDAADCGAPVPAVTGSQVAA